jgi:hypothetical protein
MRPKYLEAFRLIVQKRTRNFIKANKNEKIYEIVPVEKKYDKFGPWELDRFFGQMKLFLMLKSSKCDNEYDDFPPLWRTSEKVKLYQINIFFTVLLITKLKLD